MTVGEHIKKTRKKKGLTQKQLGALLNVSQATIQQYESGNPKIDTLQRIADALNVNIRELNPAYFGGKLSDYMHKITINPNGEVSQAIDVNELDNLFIYDDSWAERVIKTFEALPEERRQNALEYLALQRDKANETNNKDGV